MPTYTYKCKKGHEEDVIHPMCDLHQIVVKCSICKGIMHNIISGGLGFTGCGPRTLGHWADINGDRMSEDHKQHIENKRMDKTQNKMLRENN